jgi:glucuronate isomerase
MSRSLTLHADRLLPTDPGVRAIARSLYTHVRDLPIISPHGHTDPAWFVYDQPFGDAVDLLLAPDHYLYRMLYSQGVPLDELGVRSRRGAPAFEPRSAWREFASRYYLFRGTPSAIWLDQEVFVSVQGGFRFAPLLLRDLVDDPVPGSGPSPGQPPGRGASYPAIVCRTASPVGRGRRGIARGL